MAEKQKPAKADKKEKGAKEPKAKKSGGKRKLLVLTTIIAGIAVPAAGAVMLAGMLPTLAMAIGDRSSGKSLTVCVSTLNAAGVLQVLLMLSKNGLTLENAIGLLRQPESFIIMWGAAALGFGLFSFIPPMMGQLLATAAQVKIAKLRSNQKELKRIWGDQVGG